MLVVVIILLYLMINSQSIIIVVHYIERYGNNIINANLIGHVLIILNAEFNISK